MIIKIELRLNFISVTQRVKTVKMQSLNQLLLSTIKLQSFYMLKVIHHYMSNVLITPE